jgi:glycosyltransferase involved in cell wall biosynthesis
MGEILVSVVIPTFNSRKAVLKSIQSVIDQTYKNIEIVVVNDSPFDSIGNEIKNKFPRVIYFHDGINRGGGGARNIGIDIASGDFVAFLDDDDLYFDLKIMYLMEMAIKNPEYDAYFGRLERASGRKQNKFIENKPLEYKDLPLLHTNTSLIRSGVFRTLRFIGDLKKFQDTQLHLELISDFKCLGFNYTVAVWNDDEREDQITKLTGASDFKKSSAALCQLIIYFQSKAKFAVSFLLVIKLIRHIVAVPVKLTFKRMFR